MYCTLQEAYNIPAFDPSSGKKKKTCMAPLSQQLNNSKSSSQNAQQIAISQEELGAFNEYLRSKDYAAAKSQYTKEDFVGSTDQSGTQSYNIQYSTQSNRDQSGGVFDTSTPYSTQGINYKYYCDNYKICPKNQINVSENFDNKSVPDPSGPSPTTTPPAQCSSVQAPIYQYPISDAAKEQYSEAMNVSLKQENPNKPPVVPAPRVYDMNKVTGYYDEDLEQYLKTKNQVSANKTPVSDAVTKYSSQQLGIPTPNSNNDIERPYSNTREDTEGSGKQIIIKEVVEKTNNLSKLDYIIDILLFILIGILIILLCDQIFKVAMVYGMQETMRLINPYLQNLE